MSALKTLVIGTTGQLAIELRRGNTPHIELLPYERIELATPAALDDALNRLAPRLVLNAGAYTAVDRAETERERAFAVNATGPDVVARWCQRSGAALIHVSTDYVFDGQKQGPYVESDAVAPINAYGESKLAGEQAVVASLDRHLILRTSWVFSAHGQNFVKTMLRLAQERPELRVVADQVGRPTAAKELARIMLLLAERIAAGGFDAWGTYHFANRGATTWHGFAQAIVDGAAPQSGKRPNVTPITGADYPTPARRPANSVLDTSRFEHAFGIEPRPWQTDLADVLTELSARRP